MNQNYTVTANGCWWEVRRPNGKRVSEFHKNSPGDPWQRAVNTASRLTAQDRLRDQKHAELFPEQPVPLEGFAAFFASIGQAFSKAFQQEPQQSDYDLSR